MRSTRFIQGTVGAMALTVSMGFLSYAPSASATLVAYDPFLSGSNRGAGEYDPGIDIRQQGAAALGWVGSSGVDGFGVAHAGATTSNFQPNAVGEDSVAVDYEQGGRLQWIGVGNFPLDRNVTRQLNPTPSSTEWYFSIMTNRLGWSDVTTNTYAVGGFTDENGNGLQVGYDDTAGNNIPDLVLRVGGTNVVLTADAPSSANQFVFVKLTINQTGNDTIDVWIDPATLTATTPSDLTLTSFNVSDSLTPFTQSKYESPGQSGPVFWDEIRLGTTFEAVSAIPEPASLALLGLGGLAVLGRRRAA